MNNLYCSVCGQDDHSAVNHAAIQAWAAKMSAEAQARIALPLTSEDKLRIACYERGVE